MGTIKKLTELSKVYRDLADKLLAANTEFVSQNKNAEKHIRDLIDTNKKLSNDLDSAVREIEYQFNEKSKLALSLSIVNKELRESIQLNADKDLFIAILAHDLRSPFNTLLNLSCLLVDNVYKNSQAENEFQAKLLNNAAKTAFELLENILTWVKNKTGKIKFEPERVDLSALCKEIFAATQPYAAVKDIVMRCCAEDELYADIDMLRAVFRNLIGNSIKFTNRGGEINIYSKAFSTHTTVTISDNGVGIEPEDIEKLFDISGIHSTKGTEEEKGTGLGLLLCKQFIEKNGGKIWAESNYGKGCRIKFTLPKFIEATK